MNRVTIEEFLNLMKTYPAFDVRTPAEFAAGHIPGVNNLPIFTNEERAVVGTLYKKSGRQKAILTGLDIVGPKLRWLADSMRKRARDNTVLVHCWRGGMRSGSVAWLAETCGLNAITLEKGYKAYRTWCIEHFAAPRNIAILSGHTGSGKTEILAHLAEQGEQIIDLEQLAHHKGSAYGALGEKRQPTQEQFENRLADALAKTDAERRVWLEDESLHIGRCVIPDAFWPKMRAAPVVVLDLPFKRRADYLVSLYGSFNPYDLIISTQKIARRFGPERTQECVDAIESGDITRAVEISLDYYDRTYAHGLSRRDPASIIRVPVVNNESLSSIASLCIKAVKGSSH
jgi:tRNA 2-selenouridine synthase